MSHALSPPSSGDAALLRAMSLRTSRRVLACLAILSCALLKEFPPAVILSLVAVCWLEQFVPSHVYFREEEFQKAVAWICYLTLPFFLFVFIAYETANPFHDALIGFLVFFQLKWSYAPRRDFHWIGALFLLCLVVARSQSLLFGGILALFFGLSVPYLAGLQEISGAARVSVDEYISTLRDRRRARMRSLSLAPACFALGVLIFYLWPRVPGRGLALGGGSYTQLTDEVSLHKEGGLQRDYKVVGRLRLLEGALSPDDLYLRAGSLEAVSDATWTFFRDNNPPVVQYTQRGTPPSVVHNPWVFAETGRDWDKRLAKARSRNAEVRYRLTLFDPTMTWLVRLSGAHDIQMPVKLKSLGNEFFELIEPSHPLTIDARALLPVNRDGAWEVYPYLTPKEQRELMMTPDKTPRLKFWPIDYQAFTGRPTGSDIRTFKRIGQEWRGEASNNEELAQAFARRLREGYVYDIEPERPPLDPGDDPLIPFLTVDKYKRGHCEMFAASLVALLRVQGVPARLANGFRGAEVDPETGEWVVRRMRAHTWAEFWSDERGWLAIDPTPAEVFRSYEGRIYYKALRQRLERFERWWRVGVVSYDYSVQSAWFRRAARESKAAFAGLRERAAGSLRPFGWLGDKIFGDPVLVRIFWIGLAFQGALAVFAILRWIDRRREGRPGDSPGRRLSVFWGRLEKILGVESGQGRVAAETYREALERLLPRRAAERLDADLALDLARYLESCAYNAEAASRQRELELLDRAASLMERARRSSWGAVSIVPSENGSSKP